MPPAEGSDLALDALVDVRLELLQQAFALADLGLSELLAVRPHPVAALDLGQPAAELLQVLADLLGLLEGVVLAEPLELDLLEELGLALLDDLGVLLRRLGPEALNELVAGVVVDIGEGEEDAGAAQLGHPFPHLIHAGAEFLAV